MIKEKHILEFQRLYEEEFNEKITYDEALKQCIAMVDLCEIVFKPIKRKHLEKYK